MRRLGVYGESLPTKKSKNIEPADFLIGGIVGKFERKYDRTWLVRSPEEFKDIFGDHVIPTYYGGDVVKGFFDNASGVASKLFIKSYVGNVAGSIDAVVASLSALDGTGTPLFAIQSAYQEELDYGASGNRTGVTIELGDRFLTQVKTANSSSDLFVILDSVSDVKVGDVIKVSATGGSSVVVYKKVTSVEESTGKVYFANAFHTTANTLVNDVVTVPGFKMRTWRKSITGLVHEVDIELGKKWLTQESGVSDYYIENVFSVSRWIKVTDLNPATAVGATYFPESISSPSYLMSGYDGTEPVTENQWSSSLSAFDSDPIRFIANGETTDIDVQKAIETYARSRADNPKVIFNIAEEQTKSQLITIGNNFQRGDDVLGVIVANWLTRTDPFSTSSNVPDRIIPNVGHVMGAWVKTIGTLGVHYIPAVSSVPLLGINGVVGNTFLNDYDRTDLADAGINVIQKIVGSGYLIRSFFTPSTAKEFKFANGILMREYIKVSIVDSLKDTLNEPNNFARIQNSRSAVSKFFYNLWMRGSTGNTPEGETFGQTINPDTGQGTEASDHYQVQADIFNNPQTSIEVGERNIDSWFTYPTPAGSIKIGVGLMLLG